VFLAGLIELLAGYPHSAVEAAISPISGLPAKYSFMPSIAEVRAELDKWMPRQSSAAPRLCENIDKSNHPTIEQIKTHYGSSYGLHVDRKKRDRYLSAEELAIMGGLEDLSTIPDAKDYVPMKRFRNVSETVSQNKEDTSNAT
jgi:hypothetical protein